LRTNLSNATAEATLADLPAWSIRVGPTTLGSQLAAEFERQPDLPGVIVQDGPRVVGLVSRPSFFSLISGPFGREVFLKRPLAVLVNPLQAESLQLAGSCAIHEAARLALNRPPHRVYEPLIVTLDDDVKLLDIHVLLLAQAELLAQANATIQEQKDAAE